MKIIAVSQRVVIDPMHGERRDSLDQRWVKFLYAMGYIGIPLPNNLNVATKVLREIRPAGILLTGGNNIALYDGDAPERDEVEHMLVCEALNNDLSLLGVCRGLQYLTYAAGGTLKNIEGHVAHDHKITFKSKQRIVNSFHNMGIETPPPGFTITATADDGSVEAIEHPVKPILGIMWHPERFSTIQTEDIDIIHSCFGGP